MILTTELLWDDQCSFSIMFHTLVYSLYVNNVHSGVWGPVDAFAPGPTSFKICHCLYWFLEWFFMCL